MSSSASVTKSQSKKPSPKRKELAEGLVEEDDDDRGRPPSSDAPNEERDAAPDVLEFVEDLMIRDFSNSSLLVPCS